VLGVSLALVLFAFLYIGLVYATGWSVWQILLMGPPEFRYGLILWIGGMAIGVMLFVFLAKGLFRRQRMDRSLLLEIQRDDEPELFAFLDRLCKDTNAPRPRRVYLSREVNAAVFYDSSFLSLFLPTRKNLLIGLGLVNALTLDELKAVLAHEFGHFSQSSMRIGSYVYVASKVMDDMLYGRDGWDDLLDAWRRTDLRIAWAGWIVTALVGIFRMALKFVFFGIVLVHKGLSREMEFHADSVAVSVTGSDSLIRALYRLGFAEESLNFAMSELLHASDHGHHTDNYFFHQRWASEHLRERGGDPELGVPTAPDGEATRLFGEGAEAAAPNMWSSHPSNPDREERAKAVYLRSVRDERSGWCLFADPEATQAAVTALHQVELDHETQAAEDVQAFMDAELQATSFDPRWRGVYDERDLELALVRPLMKVDSEDAPGSARDALDELFDDSLDARLSDFRDSRTGDFAKALDANERFFEWCESFDRDVFVAHRRMACELGGTWEKKLLRAYRFHVRIQLLTKKLHGGIADVTQALRGLNADADRSPGVIQEHLDLLHDGYGDVRAALAKARTQKFPKIESLPTGESIGDFLLESKLVNLSDDSDIDQVWLQIFFNQTGEMLDKVGRISRKSLSSIASLHAEIGDRLSD